MFLVTPNCFNLHVCLIIHLDTAGVVDACLRQGVCRLLWTGMAEILLLDAGHHQDDDEEAAKLLEQHTDDGLVKLL